tara:strand:+ start:152 stop:577 length:426 start_codon:yes stop_codon:yes gene_type:complete
MAVDTDAQDITVNYDGGSITMAIGNAKKVFGNASSILNPSPETETISVKSHSRTRVIGGPAKSVSGYTYSIKQWPRSSSGNAAGGDVVLIRFTDSDGWFTTRVTGSMADLMNFMKDAQAVTVEFRTQRGTKYGPLYWDSTS